MVYYMSVILIGEDGKKIGNVTIEEANRQAKQCGKNLVLVNAESQVYRILDAGKIKYDKKQKVKNKRAHRRTHKIKEIKLSILTDEHDLGIKAKQIREFLKKGLKTKITLRFKGRQISFKDSGLQKINSLIMPIINEKIATLDSEPKIDGRSMVVFLTPYKE